MKNYKKINVYSRNDFEEKMHRLDLNNDNVENQIDKAFIQILETPDCISYYEKKYGNEGNRNCNEKFYSFNHNRHYYEKENMFRKICCCRNVISSEETI